MDAIKRAHIEFRESMEAAAKSAYEQSAAYVRATEAANQYAAAAKEGAAAEPGAKLGRSLADIAAGFDKATGKAQKLTGELLRLQEAGKRIEFKPDLQLERDVRLGERTLPGVLETGASEQRIMREAEWVENMNRSLDRARESQEDFQNELSTTQRAAYAAGNAFGDVFSGLARDAENFGDIAVETLYRVADAIASAAIFQPLAQAIGTGLAGIFSPSTANVPIPKLKPYASGGYVNPYEALLVGEHGPETFVPKTAGNVIPNNRLGGGDVTVNIMTEPGTQSSLQRRQGPNGQETIDVMVKSSLGRLNQRGALDSTGTVAVRRSAR
jgi:hypothetical protein